MSGIAGLYRRDGQQVEKSNVRAIVGRLAHRGPDGRGTWCEDNVAFVHQLLRTTPEARPGQQPLVADRCVFVGDMRLDNRDELLATFDDLNGSNDIPDSQLALKAYRTWGDRCPERLHGAFSFTIWDGRTSSLFCCRDRLGVKPMYYYLDENLFAFGSELTALTQLPAVPASPDEASIVAHLTEDYTDTESTFYEGLYRLPPAHTMRIDATDRTTQRYWELNPTREIQLESDDAYAAEFRKRFTEAVQDRLRAPQQPVGATLSGGLDSAAIVGVATEEFVDEDSLHTISAVFDTVSDADEREYIDAVLSGRDIVAHFVHADEIQLLPDHERLLRHLEEPVTIPMVFMHWGLYREARDNGCRVLLWGFDGDTTVGYGLNYPVELARQGRLIRWFCELDGLAERFDTPRRTAVWQRGLEPLVPEAARHWWRRLNGRRETSMGADLIDDDLAARVGKAARGPVGRASPGNFRTERRAHYSDLSDGFIPYTLEYNDRLAGLFGVEPRYPFLDSRLIEYCLALPPSQKLEDGWTRMILRRAMAGVLPEKVRWRVWKTDLSPVLVSKFQYEGNKIKDTLDRTDLSEYLDEHTLERLYDRALTEGDVAAIRAVWRAYTLALWLQKN